MQLLTSVIVPVYKVEPYLNKCIDSVVNQTYQNLEIILVDDGSPDRCPQICDEWAKKDGRIRVIHKKNGGLSDARNAGIEACSGNYIAFVDSDDYVEPDYIQTLYDAIQNEDADLAVCAFIGEGPDGNPRLNDTPPAIPVGSYTGNNFLRQTVKSNNWSCIVAWNKLYKKSLWSSYRFPVGKIHEDEFAFHHIAYASRRVVCMDQPLYHYIQNASGIMAQKYSIKNLDRIYAYLDRMRFLIDRSITDCVPSTTNMLLADIGTAYAKLDSSPPNQKVFRSAIEGFQTLYPSLKPYLTKKQKIASIGLCTCPFVWLRFNHFIHQCKNKLKSHI